MKIKKKARTREERKSEGLVIVSFRLSVRSWESFSKGGSEQVTAMFRAIWGDWDGRQVDK
jgi:hypothetical protein